MNKIEQLHLETIIESEFSEYSGHIEGQEKAASKSAEITEEVAVRFAKWVDDSSFTYYEEKGFWSSISTEEKLTSKELFELFVKNKI